MAVTEAQIAAHRNRCSLGAGPVAAGEVLYEGTMCFVTATGFISAGTAAGVNTFAGIVKDTIDNTGGGAGDLTVEFWQEGEFELPGTFAQTDVGTLRYASDNYTTTGTATANTLIGDVSQFTKTTASLVRLRPGPISA